MKMERSCSGNCLAQSLMREQQQGWMHNLASLLYHEQFEQLDTMARQLRKERKELPTHQLALAMFYESLDHPKADGDWNAHFRASRNGGPRSPSH